MSIVEIKNSLGDVAKINPEQGGALVALTLKGRDVVKYPLKTDDLQKGYPSAFLFPFPNRIRDGKYAFEGKKFEVPINDIQGNNAIHGLVAFKKFEINDFSTNELELVYNYRGNLESYPFSYQFKVKYSLLQNHELCLEFEIANTGKTTMPCGFGWHPYFGFEGSTIGDFKLKLPIRNKLELDERLLPTGEKELERFQVISLKNSILDHIYEMKNRNGLQVIELRDKANKIKVYQSAGENGLNYFVIYTPPSRNCVAIEPQSCPTNAFNSQVDLKILQPREIWNFKIGVIVE